MGTTRKVYDAGLNQASAVIGAARVTDAGSNDDDLIERAGTSYGAALTSRSEPAAGSYCLGAMTVGAFNTNGLAAFAHFRASGGRSVVPTKLKMSWTISNGAPSTHRFIVVHDPIGGTGNLTPSIGALVPGSPPTYQAGGTWAAPSVNYAGTTIGNHGSQMEICVDAPVVRFGSAANVIAAGTLIYPTGSIAVAEVDLTGRMGRDRALVAGGPIMSVVVLDSSGSWEMEEFAWYEF